MDLEDLVENMDADSRRRRRRDHHRSEQNPGGERVTGFATMWNG